MTTSSDVVAMLRRHYLPEGRPPGGILAVEIEAPDGRRRADALWAPLTLAGGPGLVGHEIKVTRSDVLAELADPTKAESWGKHCSRWWLTVSDPALVAGLDIPDAWGIMAPPSGRRTRSMTILRAAPLHVVGDTGPAWRRLASWHHYRTAETLNRSASDLQWKEREVERLREELADRQLAGEGRAHPHAVRIAALLRALDAAVRDSGRGAEGIWLHEGPSDEDIVTALVDLGKVRALAQQAGYDLDRLITAARSFADPMAGVEKKLASIRREVAV